MSENRPVNKFEQWAADERGWRRKAHMEDRAHAFEEGVDATLEMLRPWIKRIVSRRTVDSVTGETWCNGCGANLAWHPHTEYCPWPKIDAILGAGYDP